MMKSTIHGQKEMHAAEVLTRISAEVLSVSNHCIQLQDTVSTVLKSLGADELTQEMERLQDLDWIAQTLSDIASITEKIAQNDLGVIENSADLITSAKLNRLKECILQVPSQEDHGGEITWL